MEEYIVSARKYRPATFDSVVGQSALTTTLKNAVKSGKLAHAYLFCGPRGVGKTTCARIFAKAINCQSPTSDGEACNQCESCRSFNEQRSLNIFELDAASNNSVEHIKTLMEQTRIPPQVGRYKVFIIDEVHMLSTAAFNAFLKTLEEPPAHVVFILATTEKHKILPTILSRCQIYDFERMTVRDTVNHLKRVAESEGIACEDEALAVIAEKADGGMRDALSIFDQAASFCQGKITYDKVIEDLNVLDSDNYFRIIDLCLENRAADIMVLLNGIINKGFDGGLLIAGLASHVRNVLMAKDDSTLKLLEVGERQCERYREQAKKCDTNFLYRALKLMNQCDINYKQSGNKRLLVELTLIEMAQLTQPDDSPAAGRSPKRLKSLFRNLIQQPRPASKAQQVASAGQVSNAAGQVATPVAYAAPGETASMVRETEHSGSITATTGSITAPAAGATALTAGASEAVKPEKQPTAVYNAATRPVLKGDKGTIGFSWSNMKQQSRQSKMVVLPGTLDANDPNARPKDEYKEFTQQDLEYQWMAMCNRMPQRMCGLAARMKNMIPKITAMPAIEVWADNGLILEQMEGIKGSIVNTLKLYLGNNSITVDLKVADKPQGIRILTRREQYEELSKQNPAVAKLQEMFGLELA